MFSVLLMIVELGTLWHVRMPNLIKEIACTTHMHYMYKQVRCGCDGFSTQDHSCKPHSSYPPVGALLNVATAGFDTTDLR